MGGLPRDSPIGEKGSSPEEGRRRRRGGKIGRRRSRWRSHPIHGRQSRVSGGGSQMINMALGLDVRWRRAADVAAAAPVRSSFPLFYKLARFPSFRIAGSAAAALRARRVPSLVGSRFPDGLVRYRCTLPRSRPSVRPAAHPSWRRHTCHSHACHLVRR